MEPLISVIIPVYNMEQYLSRCLDSVLNNTYLNLEVICIDDGSKDSSLKILREYEKKDSRVVVIAKENGGVSSARNAGLERVTGQYVSFVDPDDFVHPQFYELLLATLKGSKSDISLCGFLNVEEKDLPLKEESVLYPPENIRIVNCTELFQNHNFRSFCWGRLIAAELIKGLRFREELPYSEDSVFMAELGERNPTLICSVFDKLLYYYVQRETSLVKQAKLPNRFRVAEIYTEKTLAAEDNDRIYLDQAIKRSLSTRYYADHIQLDKQISRKCTLLLNSCLPSLKNTDIYSGKQKAAYTAFIHFPSLYWLYRSITEPDMWAWEKVERKKRREEKRNTSQ